MKRSILFIPIILCFLYSTNYAQEVGGGSVKLKLKTIPVLHIEGIVFLDEDDNGKLKGEEQCYFELTIKNSGRNPVRNPLIETNLLNDDLTDLLFERKLSYDQIDPGQVVKLTIPVTGTLELKSGKANFNFIVSDNGKYKSSPKQFLLNLEETSNRVHLSSEWYYPVDFNTTVNESKLNVRLCVRSEFPLTEILIYVNDKLYQNMRSFGPMSNEICNYTINKELYLEKGLNEIKLKIKNKGRTIFTEKRLVTYKPEIFEKRNALVFGNSNYDSSPLKNPINDAKSMAKTLRDLNFDVIEVLDADKLSMRDAVRKFKDKMEKDKGVGLFYYAGHGVQVKGENFLIPVKHDIKEEYDIQDEALRINTVISYMQDAGTRMNIVILDACRDNPFESSMRSSSRGLATIHAEGSGTIIAYATSPGSTASDGDGENGLFTQELLKAVKTPGLEIGMIFRHVLANVQKLSDGKQIPWTNSSIVGEFYFLK